MYAFEPDNASTGPANNGGNQPVFYVQTSLLYTNEARQRMLRVHNYSVKISREPVEIYGAMDYQSVIAAIVRRKLSSFVSQVPLIDLQLDVINEFKKLFNSIAAQTPVDFQQRMLPYIALGFLGVLKSSVFQAHFINNCVLTSQKQQRGLGGQQPPRSQQGLRGLHL